MTEMRAFDADATGTENDSSANIAAFSDQVLTISARTLTADDWQWHTWAEGQYGYGTYRPERFDLFLAAAGYSDGRRGVPPELPEWAVDETEAEHVRWRRRGVPGAITYFARGKFSGRIKIGMTRKRPEVRVRELKQDKVNGEEAELLATRRGEHFEGLYHKAFHTWRIGGEWFAPHPDILSEIERLS